MKTRYNSHNLAVAKIAAKEGRPELTAVDFTPAYTIASDGFRMVKVTTPQSEAGTIGLIKTVASPGTLLIPREVVVGIKLPKPSKAVTGIDAVYLTKVEGDKATLTTLDIENGTKKDTETVKGAGTRPAFEGLLEDALNEKGITFTVNTEYLIELLKIAKGISPKVTINVPLKKGKAVAMRTTGGDKQEMEALIMPINSETV